MKKPGRSRLTITLRKDLLPQLDAIIDGEKIRNRSHAIEFILSQHLGPKIRQAVVLAGGQGVKMRPFTYELPKTMIPVKGKPILQHILEQIRGVGITNIHVVIGRELGEKITHHFGDGSKLGLNLTYHTEKNPAGTAGALRTVKEAINGPFLLYYGDVLANIDLNELIRFHKDSGSMMSATLTATDKFSDYGVVKLKGNKVVDFVEKPTTNKYLGLVNAGIFMVDPEVMDVLPDSTPASLEQDVLPKLAQRGMLAGYPFDGQWYDISTPEVYERVLKEWIE
ncbi:MAG: sugar phosphate nucleotidyltransferase [bacterium]|nr:sugar phosphate nucleotidyltransferase [bacterium]